MTRTWVVANSYTTNSLAMSKQCETSNNSLSQSHQKPMLIRAVSTLEITLNTVQTINLISDGNQHISENPGKKI